MGIIALNTIDTSLDSPNSGFSITKQTNTMFFQLHKNIAEFLDQHSYSCSYSYSYIIVSVSPPTMSKRGFSENDEAS